MKHTKPCIYNVLYGYLRYLYGEPVKGTAYVVFGVKINQEMIRLPSVEKVTDVSPSECTTGALLSLSDEVTQSWLKL